MKKRSIVMNEQQVLSILQGKKTMDRRIILPQPSIKMGVGKWIKNDKIQEIGDQWIVIDYMIKHNPFGQPGDVLMVKESCKAMAGKLPDVPDGVCYKADNTYIPIENTREASEKWMDLRYYNNIEEYLYTLPKHMPEWAGRIFLKIESVNVERLQQITKQDAIAEGIGSYVEERMKSKPVHYQLYWTEPGDDSMYSSCPILSYESLWKLKNGPESWDADPWVWVIEFSIQLIKI
jgi:hypothetical protein